MKSSFVLILILFFVVIAAHAQTITSPPKFLASFNVGPSFPLGKFGEKKFYMTQETVNDEHPPGNARTGLDLRIAASYRLIEHTGLAVELRWASHKGERQTLIDHVLETSGPGFIFATSQKWRTASALAGFYYEDHLSAGWSFRLKGLAGAAKITVPGYSYGWTSQATIPSAYFATHSKIKLPVTFAGEAGVELRYAFARQWFALISADYFYAVGSYRYHVAGIGLPEPIGTPIRKRYPVNAANIVAGLGLKW